MIPRRPGSGSFVSLLPSTHESARRLLGEARNFQIGAMTADDLETKLARIQRAGDAVLQALAMINGACGVATVSPPTLSSTWTASVDALADEYERTGGFVVHGEEPSNVTESIWLDAGDREEMLT